MSFFEEAQTVRGHESTPVIVENATKVGTRGDASTLVEFVIGGTIQQSVVHALMIPLVMCELSAYRRHFIVGVMAPRLGAG